MFWAVLNLYTNICQIKVSSHQYPCSVDCSCYTLWFKWHLSGNSQPVIEVIAWTEEGSYFPSRKRALLNSQWWRITFEGVCHKNGWWDFKPNGLLCETEGNMTLNYDAFWIELGVSKEVMVPDENPGSDLYTWKCTESLLCTCQSINAQKLQTEPM